MTAVTADRNYKIAGTPTIETFPITSAATVYVGALVNRVDATGCVSSATDAAGETFCGIVVGLPDGSATGNVGGTIRAQVAWNCLALLAVDSNADDLADGGKNVTILDNQTVSVAGTTTNDVKVGALVRHEASDRSTAWVALRQFAASDA